MPSDKILDADELSVFVGVRDWVFDLDDTLYPPESGIFTAVMSRIRAYTARVLGCSPEEAHALQKDYAARYGTTLRGLMEEHGVDPEAFLADAHAVDYSALTPNPDLSKILARLPGRKFILTSGTHAHVERTLSQLGIGGNFDGVFDIVDANYLPKPAEATYTAFMDRFAIDPMAAAMFEDAPRNLVVPHALGMRAILVVSEAGLRWEASVADFVTANLAAFLSQVADALSI